MLVTFMQRVFYLHCFVIKRLEALQMLIPAKATATWQIIPPAILYSTATKAPSNALTSKSFGANLETDNIPLITSWNTMRKSFWEVRSSALGQ